MENLTGIGNALIGAGQAYRRGMRDEANYQRQLKEHEEDRQFQQGQREFLGFQQEGLRNAAVAEDEALASDAITFADEKADPFVSLQKRIDEFEGYIGRANAEQAPDDEAAAGAPGTVIAMPQGSKAMRAPAALVEGGKATAASRQAASATVIPGQKPMKGGKPGEGLVKASPSGKTSLGYATAIGNGYRSQIDGIRKDYEATRQQVAKAIGTPPSDPAELPRWKAKAAAIMRRYAPKLEALSARGSEIMNAVTTTEALHSMGKVMSRVTALPWNDPDAFVAQVDQLAKENPGNPYIPMLKNAKMREIDLDPTGKGSLIERVIDFGGGLMVTPGEMLSMATGAITLEKLAELGSKLTERMSKVGEHRISANERANASVFVSNQRENVEETRNRLATEAEKERELIFTQMDSVENRPFKNLMVQSGDINKPVPGASAEFQQLQNKLIMAQGKLETMRPGFTRAAGVDARVKTAETREERLGKSDDQRNDNYLVRDIVFGLVDRDKRRTTVTPEMAETIATRIKAASNPSVVAAGVLQKLDPKQYGVISQALRNNGINPDAAKSTDTGGNGSSTGAIKPKVTR